MPNTNDFAVIANSNILDELHLCLPYSPDSDVILVGSKMFFSVYHTNDMDVVKNIRKISRKYPDETMYVFFTPENYNWFKEERYQVKNGTFFFIGIKWQDGLEHDWSDNQPKLLIVMHGGHNHLIPDLAAYHLP